MRKRYFLMLLLAFSAVCAFAQPVTINPPSPTIQPGQSVTLTASGAVYYQWSPPTGLSTTEGPVTVASPTVTTTYTCEGYAPGAESVVNGDFSQGNVGFTSAYEYNTNLWNEGTYYVDHDASLHHENFFGQGHGDNGNFMIVNGATSPNTNVWTEQITVQPNKYYAFSTWVCTLAGQANEVALLQFSINGIQIGEVFSAPPERYIWEQFYELWFSGNSTTATITILNQNTGGSGNDFGLDDISFRELVLVGNPTCTVYVGNMTATASADDTELCEGESTTLHALPVNGSGSYSYSWTPANTLDDPTSQHPVATPPLGSTTYTCHVSDDDWGNTQDVSVTIVVHPNKETQVHQAICSGDSFNFYGQELTTEGEYEHTLQTQYGCDSIIRLTLTVWPANPDTTNHIVRCPEDLPYYYENDPDHIPLYGGDMHIFHLQDIHGCDSTVIVEVESSNYNEYDYGSVYAGYYNTPSYDWNIPEANTTITYTTEGLKIDTLPTSTCEGIFKLDLHFRQIPETQHDTAVACDRYPWYVHNVLVGTYENDTVVLYSIPIYDNPADPSTQYMYYDPSHPNSPIPCTEDHILHLTVNHESVNNVIILDGDDPTTLPPDISQLCDSYPWHLGGETHIFEEDTPPEGFTDTIPTLQGCDSIVTIHIMNMDYTPQPVIYCPIPDSPNPHWPITATEFNVNRYTYRVRDDGKSDISKWKMDQCEWRLSKNSWRIVTDPDDPLQCIVYPMDWVPDSILLSFKAVNRCDSTIAKYWLHPSFYGVNEQETTLPEFSIVPNPNDGQMTLVFSRFEGKVGVKVYDVIGNLLDSFETYNDGESKSVEYQLHSSKGIYFIVANGKEGTLTKKVIIY